MTKRFLPLFFIFSAAGTLSAETPTFISDQTALDSLPETVPAADVYKIASNSDLTLGHQFELNGKLYNSGTGTTNIQTIVGGNGELIAETGTFRLDGAVSSIGQNVKVSVSENARFVFNAYGTYFKGVIAGMNDECGNIDVCTKTNFSGASVAGTVNVLAGGEFVVAADTTVTGTLNLGAGTGGTPSSPTSGGTLKMCNDNYTEYGNLTVNGDLNCSAWTLPADSEGVVYIADFGSVVRLAAGTLLDVAGTANLAGKVEVVGFSNSPLGKVYKVMRAGKIEGEWNFVSAGDNTLLVTGGVAGLAQNEMGVARIETKNLQERDFRRHKGFGEFIDYLSDELMSSVPNETAQAVALASSGKNLTDTINAFSPSVYAAFPAIAGAQSSSEVDYLRRIFPVGLSAPRSEDGIHVEDNWQGFVNLQYESSANRRTCTSPTFDFQSFGVLAGAYTWLDDGRLAGASLGIYRATAWSQGFHKNGDNLGDTAFRLRFWTGIMPPKTSWNLLFGGHAGGHYYDIGRLTDLGVNEAKERGFDAGFFALWQMKIDCGDTWSFSPFARLDFNYTRVDTVREHGTASALDVSAFGYASWQARAGTSIEKTFDSGRKDLKSSVGLDLALAGTLHSDTYLSSRFVKYANSATSVKAFVSDDAAIECSPYLRLALPGNWQFDMVYRARLGSEGNWTHAVSAGVSTQF